MKIMKVTSRNAFILCHIFAISYILTNTEAACNKTIRIASDGPTTGIIESYSWSQVGQECMYKIIAPTGRRIKLDFSFNLFRLYHSRQCVFQCSRACDHIQLNNYELSSHYVHLLRSCSRSRSYDCLWCGVPPPSISKTNWISFRTLLKSFFSDFRAAKWTLVDGSSASDDVCNHTTVIDAKLNDSLVYDTRHLLVKSDPKYCEHHTFKIVGPEGKRLKLYFTDFNINYAVTGYADTCTPQGDYIQLKNYDVDPKTFYNRVLVRCRTCSPFACEYIWCDFKHPPPLVSKNNIIYIHAYFTRKSSFAARWDIIMTPETSRAPPSGTTPKTTRFFSREIPKRGITEPPNTDITIALPTIASSRPIATSSVNTHGYISVYIAAFVPIGIIIGFITCFIFITYFLCSRKGNTIRGFRSQNTSETQRTSEIQATNLPRLPIFDQAQEAQMGSVISSSSGHQRRMPPSNLSPLNYDSLDNIPSEPPPPYSSVCSSKV